MLLKQSTYPSEPFSLLNSLAQNQRVRHTGEAVEGREGVSSSQLLHTQLQWQIKVIVP